MLVLPLLIFLFLGLETDDTEGIISLIGAAVFMVVIYWVIFPRKYCIFNNKVKVVLGKPLSFNIPFKNIETARPPQGLALGINFATALSAKDSVEIVRRKRLNVNITPSNPKLFLEKLDEALTNWRSYNA